MFVFLQSLFLDFLGTINKVYVYACAYALLFLSQEMRSRDSSLIFFPRYINCCQGVLSDLICCYLALINVTDYFEGFV